MAINRGALEKVINALTSKSFSRAHFLSSLDRFYGAIEETAVTIDDFSQKQDFLNTIYERFFQGFSIKVADTHGIVYTPQPIVNFMVKSVENILQREFGKSLIDKGVHVLDPFVGTGNFIIRIMREIAEIQKSALPYKYANELHCNEVMLLPYYIASMNIEHEYFEQTGRYESFDSICMVDTFELTEGQQLVLFNAINTQRVEQQKQKDIFIIIGNPPYNANQQNEMDLNKNRKHDALDDRIKKTYISDCASVGRTTRKLLFDPYIKAFRWATDRIGKEGIVCFVSNNSFLDQDTFGGMRKNLERDFNKIYCLDLGGNVRKNPKLSGTIHNVFGIQVGVSISILIKKENQQGINIFYKNVNEFWHKEDKCHFLERSRVYSEIDWEVIEPTKNYIWLGHELKPEYDEHIALASQETKSSKLDFELLEDVVFDQYALGVSTNRDDWLYSYSHESLKENVSLFCETYNTEIARWRNARKPGEILKFVTNDSKRIKWSSLLIDKFKREKLVDFDETKIRISQWRPFSKKYLYFDNVLIDAPTLQRFFFPTLESEIENRAIWLKIGSEISMYSLMIHCIPNLLTQGGSQCFPFYTYDEDGTNRRENITDWVLEQFQTHYKDPTITKWDIFYYTYAVLHHPHYRTRYAANLKRELPRIPYAPEFRPFATAGQRLAEIHVHYEDQPEYPLKHLEDKDLPIDWRVEKMRLSKDKTQLKYNDFLTLTGIPPEVFKYRLGNRSALDWVIDQYRVKTDQRSGITNDPNRLDDEEYIVRLIKKVITVSLETVKIVDALPDLGLPKD